MSLHRMVFGALCALFLFSAHPAAAEESCSDEIQRLEAAAKKSPSSRGDEAEFQIALAAASLEVVCDEFDEWETSPEAQRAKDDAVARLRAFAEGGAGISGLDDDDDDDDLDF